MSFSMDDILVAALQHFAEVRPFLSMYIHLLLSALFPIYTGAHASLSRPSSAAKPTADRAEEDDGEKEVVQQMEGLSPMDAIVFPVTAAIVLAALYFLIQRYGADVINFILGWYFAAVGVYSVGRLINDSAAVLLSFIFPTYFVRNRVLYKIDSNNRKAVPTDAGNSALEIPAPWMVWPDFLLATIWTLRSAIKQKYATKAFIRNVVDFKANLTLLNVLSASIGLASVIYANFSDKPWWLTNLQGFAVCFSAMQLLSPTTFATGSLILAGLFCYDVWAVFFTPLMVTVAKNIDQPIKLVFPRPDEPSLDPSKPPTKSYSMLGLGDIVLPGILIGLALRFDLYLCYLKKQRVPKQSTRRKTRSSSGEATVEKAPYVRVTGGWGDWFWTLGFPKDSLPDKLKCSFPKPYFTAGMTGYVVGMITTLIVMSVFNHAQPALLYLVPGVVISLWTCGLIRGEIKEMWEFTEAITGEQLDDDEELKIKHGEDESKKEDESWLHYIWRSVVGDEEDKSSSQKANESKTNETDESGTEKEGLIFLFSVTEWKPNAESHGAVKKANLTKDADSGNAEDSPVLVSIADYDEDNVPATRSRTTTRRRKV